MENLNPIITALAGILGTVILFMLFPDIRRAKVGREHAESDKVTAESDSIQLKAIADYLIAATKSTIEFSQAIQANSNGFAESLKRVADSNIELLGWVREKEKEIAEERHLFLSRIEELGGQVHKLQDEKTVLEETLESANIKIAKLEDEVKQLKKDNKASNIEIEKLKVERDQLLSQMANVSMPQLEADNLSTRILGQDGKDEIPSTAHVVIATADADSS